MRWDRCYPLSYQDVRDMLAKRGYGVVVGGTRKICMEMKSPERSMSMWFTGVYKEVSRPFRLPNRARAK